EHILNEEKIPFEPATLPVIVRAAEGSLRDALSLLDTAIAYGDGRLEAETTAKLLGATAPVTVRAFATAVIGHDTGAALEAIDRAARDGEDLLAFARDVIELLRLTLVLKAAPNAKPADLTHTEGYELRKLGEAASLDEILYVLRAFLEADALMRESPHPRVELEIATVRSTRRPVPQALDDVLRRVDEAQREIRQQALATPWERVVDEVMKKKPTLGAVLMQARPSGVSDRELTIVLHGNHFHREMLADVANRELVVQAVRRCVAGAERVNVVAGGEST